MKSSPSTAMRDSGSSGNWVAAVQSNRSCGNRFFLPLLVVVVVVVVVLLLLLPSLCYCCCCSRLYNTRTALPDNMHTPHVVSIYCFTKRCRITAAVIGMATASVT